MINRQDYFFESKQEDIIKSWHNISINEETSYVKFFANWISFNAICYALFHKEAVREKIDFDNNRNLPNLKSRLESQDSISLEKGEISQPNKNIKVKLEFPEALNLTINERFIEFHIFEEFKKAFKDKINFEAFFLNNYVC